VDAGIVKLFDLSLVRRPGEMHHRRGQAPAFGIRDHERNAGVHGGHQRIGRAEIDAHDLAHNVAVQAA